MIVPLCLPTAQDSGASDSTKMSALYDKLPYFEEDQRSTTSEPPSHWRKPPHATVMLTALPLLLALCSIPLGLRLSDWMAPHTALDPFAMKQWETSLLRCEQLHDLPGVPADFWKRKESDRFLPVSL